MVDGQTSSRARPDPASLILFACGKATDSLLVLVGRRFQRGRAACPRSRRRDHQIERTSCPISSAPPLAPRPVEVTNLEEIAACTRRALPIRRVSGSSASLRSSARPPDRILAGIARVRAVRGWKAQRLRQRPRPLVDEGNGDRDALIWESEAVDHLRRPGAVRDSRSGTARLVARAARALAIWGCGKRPRHHLSPDRARVPIAMLACATGSRPQRDLCGVSRPGAARPHRGQPEQGRRDGRRRLSRWQGHRPQVRRRRGGTEDASSSNGSSSSSERASPSTGRPAATTGGTRPWTGQRPVLRAGGERRASSC